jgi:hypothetical protein
MKFRRASQQDIDSWNDYCLHIKTNACLNKRTIGYSSLLLLQFSTNIPQIRLFKRFLLSSGFQSRFLGYLVFFGQTTLNVATKYYNVTCHLVKKVLLVSRTEKVEKHGYIRCSSSINIFDNNSETCDTVKKLFFEIYFKFQRANWMWWWSSVIISQVEIITKNYIQGG